MVQMLSFTSCFVFFLISCVHCEPTLSSSARVRDFGILNNAFVTLFEKDSKILSKLTRLYEKAKSVQPTFQKSRYRRRCTGYMMCPKRESMYELENVIFYNDKIYLANLDKQSLNDIAEMKTFYHGYNPPVGKEHLPGMFIFFKGFDWPLGPEIVTYTSETIGQTGLPLGADGQVKCAKVWDTTAQFLFPWQPPNTFHGMNDNALYVVTQALLQYATSFDTEFSSSRPFADVENEEELMQAIRHILPMSRSVFFFNQMPKFNGQKPSNGFRLLKLLYGTENMHPAQDIMSGGPHCVSHVSYGNGFKPFFRDGIVDLRNALYELLQFTFRTHPGIQASINELGPKIWSSNSTASTVPGATVTGTGAHSPDPYAQKFLPVHNKESALRIKAHHEKVARARTAPGGVPLSVSDSTQRKGVSTTTTGSSGVSASVPATTGPQSPAAVALAASRLRAQDAVQRERIARARSKTPLNGKGQTSLPVTGMAAAGATGVGTTTVPATTSTLPTATAVTNNRVVPTSKTNSITSTADAMAVATAAKQAQFRESRAGVGHTITATGGARARMPGSSRALAEARPVRVVVMSRNWGAIKPHRNLDPSAEEAIKVGFEGRGAQVVICCSPTEGQTMEGMVAYMHEADICVGMHGAGLINCAYSAHKVTVVEIQHTFGRHFDGFMKGAHMTQGVYVNYDIRHIKHLSNDMYPLPTEGVKALVDLAMVIYDGLLHNNLKLKSIKHRRLLVAGTDADAEESEEEYMYYNRTESGDHRELSAKNPHSSAFAVHNARPYMNVFLPPKSGIIDKRSVLGPKWEDTFKVCRALVYCEHPGNQHITEEDCDGWGFMWKRTNSVKTVLDPSFYNLQRSKSLLFD